LFNFTHHQEVAAEYKYTYYSGNKVLQYYVEDNGKYTPKPVATIQDKDKSKIIGRRIVGHSLNFGSSGGYPGDPRGLGKGFFGILLDAKTTLSKQEWIVVTITDAASHHCLLDSRWIETFYTSVDLFKPKYEPWFIRGRGFSIQKDEFTEFIKGCVITDIILEPESCKITLEKDGQKHLLEILNTDPRLCPWSGVEYKVGKETRYALPKAFKEGTDEISNYIIFMEENGQIYV